MAHAPAVMAYAPLLHAHARTPSSLDQRIKGQHATNTKSMDTDHPNTSKHQEQRPAILVHKPGLLPALAGDVDSAACDHAAPNRSQLSKSQEVLIYPIFRDDTLCLATSLLLIELSDLDVSMIDGSEI